MPNRTILIGDIHGCFEELLELLDMVQVTAQDHVVSLGDMVDRGPHPREVVEWFMSRDRPEARSAIVGNHDAKMASYLATDTPKFRSGDHAATYQALEPRHGEWFRSLPAFQRLGHKVPDGLEIVIAHAGVVPGVLLEKQSPKLLRTISFIEPAEAYNGEEKSYWASKAPKGAQFWANLYDGSIGHVVFGHTGFDAPALFPHATGIDTGCCFGRILTALVLPDFYFVSVKSRQPAKNDTELKRYELAPGIWTMSG